MEQLKGASVIVGSSLTQTHQTRLERLARDKLSIIYEITAVKSFITWHPGVKVIKLYFLRH